jgi:3-methyladenine DNA glycosylase/8-oxoguanine DNA glycosylase
LEDVVLRARIHRGARGGPVSKQSVLQAAGKMPLMERGKDSGRFTNKVGKKTVVAEIARSILEQPAHIKMLKSQARNGVGKDSDQLPPATHKMLFEYAYGGPPRAKEDDLDKEKMAALQAAARAYLREHPDRARVIDISVQRSAAALPRTKAPDGDDPTGT